MYKRQVIEEARAAAHEAGLPFSEKPYRDGADFNPYVFDGSMSIEDFELMHRMIEKERSEQMAEPILSGYLSNLGKYTEGRPAGEWVTFPTTCLLYTSTLRSCGSLWKPTKWSLTP